MTLDVLTAAALALVFVRGSIFDIFRRRGPAWWRELAGCALCAGFWAGAGWHLFEVWQLHGWNFHVQTVAASSFACGVLSAVLALSVVRVWDWLEAAAEAHEAAADSLRSPPSQQAYAAKPAGPPPKPQEVPPKP